MATRPVFIVGKSSPLYVEVRMVEFSWVPGMAKTQKQKCIDSLHEAIIKGGVGNVLEVSSKSREPLGIQLSAFNLGFAQPNTSRFVSVESAFQGSKVFEKGGPFPELYSMNARDAKNYFKEKMLGRLIGFSFYGQAWPLSPFTLFYDWIYLNSLRKNTMLSQHASKYDCFTDIEFNPVRSINCQAYSVALFVSLCRRGEMEEVLDNRDSYIYAMQKQPNWIKNTEYAAHHSDCQELLL